MSEDEEAIVQEREEDAEPDVEPVEEVEEDELEQEVEEENEERESERIEEREEIMVSEPKVKKPRGRSKKTAKRPVAKPKRKSR